jgi:monothiol glutaredoxin
MTDPIAACIEHISEDVAKYPIVLFMKGTKQAPQCGFSGQVVHILNELGAEYETRDILADPVLREAIKQFSDWPTLPQLYINGEFIGGCDIVTELYENGELKELVEVL